MAENLTGKPDPFANGPSLLMEKSIEQQSTSDNTQDLGPIATPSSAVMAGVVDERWAEAGKIKVDISATSPSSVLASQENLENFINEYSGSRNLEEESEADSMPGPKRPLSEVYPISPDVSLSPSNTLGTENLAEKREPDSNNVSVKTEKPPINDTGKPSQTLAETAGKPEPEKKEGFFSRLFGEKKKKETVDSAPDAKTETSQPAYRVVGEVKPVPADKSFTSNQVIVDLDLEKEVDSKWSNLAGSRSEGDIETAYRQAVAILTNGELKNYPDAADVKMPSPKELVGYDKIDFLATDTQSAASPGESAAKKAVSRVYGEIYEILSATKNAAGDRETNYEVGFWGEYYDGRTVHEVEPIYGKGSKDPDEAYRTAEENFLKVVVLQSSAKIPEITKLDGYGDVALKLNKPALASTVSTETKAVEPNKEQPPAKTETISPTSVATTFAEKDAKTTISNESAAADFAKKSTGQATKEEVSAKLNSGKSLSDDEFQSLMAMRRNRDIEGLYEAEKKLGARFKGTAVSTETSAAVGLISSTSESKPASTATPSAQVNQPPKESSESKPASTVTPSAQVNQPPKESSESKPASTKTPSSETPKPSAQVEKSAQKADSQTEFLNFFSQKKNSITSAEIAEAKEASKPKESTVPSKEGKTEPTKTDAVNSTEQKAKGDETPSEKLSKESAAQAFVSDEEAAADLALDAYLNSGLTEADIASMEESQKQSEKFQTFMESKPPATPAKSMKEAGSRERSDILPNYNPNAPVLIRPDHNAAMAEPIKQKESEKISPDSAAEAFVKPSAQISAESAATAFTKSEAPSDQQIGVSPESAATSLVKPSVQVSTDYEIVGSVKPINAENVSLSLKLVDKKTGKKISETGSSGQPLAEAYSTATDSMKKRLTERGLDGVEIPAVDKLEGVDLVKLPAAPGEVLGATASQEKEPEKKGFFGKIKDLITGSNDEASKKEADSSAVTNKPNLAEKFGEKSSGASAEAIKSTFGLTLEEQQKVNRGEDLYSDENDEDLSKVEAASTPNVSQVLNSEAKAEKTETASSAASTESVSVSAYPALTPAAQNAIMNPPNPVVNELAGVREAVVGSSEAMTSGVSSAVSGAIASIPVQSASSATYNTVNNGGQFTQPQPSNPESIAPGQASQMAQVSQPGAMSSDHYMRLLYEAIVTHGVKLRTV
jgi:hypothetical protein